MPLHLNYIRRGALPKAYCFISLLLFYLNMHHDYMNSEGSI